MHPEGFKPTIAVSEQPQIQALDRAAIKIGYSSQILNVYTGLRLLVSFTLRPLQFQLYVGIWRPFNGSGLVPRTGPGALQETKTASLCRLSKPVSSVIQPAFKSLYRLSYPGFFYQ